MHATCQRCRLATHPCDCILCLLCVLSRSSLLSGNGTGPFKCTAVTLKHTRYTVLLTPDVCLCVCLCLLR